MRTARRRWPTSSTRWPPLAGLGSPRSRSPTPGPGARSRRCVRGLRPEGSGELRARRRAGPVEDDLDQPRPAARTGARFRAGDPPEAAGDHRDVLPLEVLAQLARALRTLDELVAERVEADRLRGGAHHVRPGSHHLTESSVVRLDLRGEADEVA